VCAKTLELAKQHANNKNVPMIFGIEEYLILQFFFIWKVLQG